MPLCGATAAVPKKPRRRRETGQTAFEGLSMRAECGLRHVAQRRMGRLPCMGGRIPGSAVMI